MELDREWHKEGQPEARTCIKSSFCHQSAVQLGQLTCSLWALSSSTLKWGIGLESFLRPLKKMGCNQRASVKCSSSRFLLVGGHDLCWATGAQDKAVQTQSRSTVSSSLCKALSCWVLFSPPSVISTPIPPLLRSPP